MGDGPSAGTIDLIRWTFTIDPAHRAEALLPPRAQFAEEVDRVGGHAEQKDRAGLLQPVGPTCRERYRCPRLSEGLGDRHAESRGRSGYDRHLAVDPKPIQDRSRGHRGSRRINRPLADVRRGPAQRFRHPNGR